MKSETIKFEMINETEMIIRTDGGSRLTFSANRDDCVFILSDGQKEYFFSKDFLEFVLGMMDASFCSTGLFSNEK